MMWTTAAAAEGERTPMIGGAATFTDQADRDVELVGAQLELAWWPLGVLGLAVEGSARRGVEADDTTRNLSVAGSARFLAASWMWPSLLEPRDVEMGLEVHAIAERTWWGRDDRADAFGLGLALRMRGGSDREFSDLLAESRLFVRAMRSRDELGDVAARAGAMTDPPALTIIVGLGAAFGAGKQPYLDRFRQRALDPMR